jgi:hypothetical protein
MRAKSKTHKRLRALLSSVGPPINIEEKEVAGLMMLGIRTDVPCRADHPLPASPSTE